MRRGPGRAERHRRLDHGPAARCRAHLEAAPEKGRPLAHAEQAQMASGHPTSVSLLEAAAVVSDDDAHGVVAVGEGDR